jgi:hypothetical protein
MRALMAAVLNLLPWPPGAVGVDFDATLTRP